MPLPTALNGPTRSTKTSETYTVLGTGYNLSQATKGYTSKTTGKTMTNADNGKDWKRK